MVHYYSLFSPPPDGDASAPDPLRVACASRATFERLKGLPKEEALAILAQLEKVAQMVVRASEALGIEAPALLVPHGYESCQFSSTDEPFEGLGATLPHPFESAVLLSARHVKGLGALVPDLGQTRDDLCLDDEELYAVIAHEVGHLAHGHNRHHVPLYRGEPAGTLLGVRFGWRDNQAVRLQAATGNHRNEYEADADTLRAGGSREALNRALLKIVRDYREQIYHEGFSGVGLALNRAQGAQRTHAQRVADRQEMARSNLYDGSETHPSQVDRDAMMRVFEEDPASWQERVKTQQAKEAAAPSGAPRPSRTA